MASKQIVRDDSPLNKIGISEPILTQWTGIITDGEKRKLSFQWKPTRKCTRKAGIRTRLYDNIVIISAACNVNRPTPSKRVKLGKERSIYMVSESLLTEGLLIAEEKEQPDSGDTRKTTLIKWSKLIAPITNQMEISYHLSGYTEKNPARLPKSITWNNWRKHPADPNWETFRK